MFKEFGLIFLLFIVAVVFFRKIEKWNDVIFGKICIGIILLTCIGNFFYNIGTVYPTFVYEDVPIGDSEENLLAYKKDSQFRWLLLNTISTNRQIYLDQEGELYERYFDIFAQEVETIAITEEARELMVKREEDFEKIGAMDMIDQLSYAFLKWKGGELPQLFISLEQLEGCDALIAITRNSDTKSSLYVMSTSYFQDIMEQEKLP